MSAILFLRLLLPFSFGCALGSLYRVVNAVVGPDIAAELHLSAEQIGLLTSFFFLFYAGVQIPLGMALDRFGARRVAANLFALAASGAVIFASASDFTILMIARALMGIGISVALMGALKAVVDWVPRDKLPSTNSLIMATGGLGVMAATYPVQLALHFTDWRGVFLGIAVLTAVVVLAILFVAPEPRRIATVRAANPLRGVAQIFSNRQFLQMIPLGSAAQGVNMAMSGLWAGPWLRDVSGLSRDETATVLFGMATMVTVSVFMLGALAERLTRVGLSILDTARIGIAGFIFFECLIIANPPVHPAVLWLPYAFCATAPTLFYSVLATNFTPDMAGRVNTAYNFTTFAFAFVVQWALGAVIDLWPPLAPGSFAPEGYRWGFASIVAFQLATFVWFFIAPRALRPR